MRRVYIAMPINQAQGNHVEAFLRAGELVREFGMEPVLPIDGISNEQWSGLLRQHTFRDACAQLVESDLRQLQSCDAVLAVVPAPSVGIAMEICYACRWGLRVVVVANLRMLYHPWLQYHSDYVIWSEDPFGEGLRDAVLLLRDLWREDRR